ncbi:MAG TPA: hypothetical protein VGK44_00925 [Casimicrobiaceae bacterium]
MQRLSLTTAGFFETPAVLARNVNPKNAGAFDRNFFEHRFKTVRGDAMQTVAHGDGLRRVPEIEDARSINWETNERTIEGVLWALAIMAPVYVVIAWMFV